MQHDRTVFGAAVAAGLIAAPISGAMPPVPEEDALDFSDVTSIAVAEELVEQGALVIALFFPARYGGTDHLENMGWRPGSISRISSGSWPRSGVATSS